MKYIWVVSCGMVMTLSGCSWLYGENGLIHDSSNDYLKAKQAKQVQLPEGYSGARMKNELNIPSLTATAAQRPSGDALDKTPPAQILAVTSGLRINRQSQDPGVFWMGTQEQLTANLKAFMESKEINFNQQGAQVSTDWVTLDNEAWWRSVFGTDLPRFVRNKFILQSVPGVRSGELGIIVKHVEHQQMPYDEDVWNTHPLSKKIAVEFLNQFVGYLDYLERLDNAKRLSQLNRGFTIRLGKNKNNDAAYIADTDWQTVWLKSPKILEPFGFTLADKDNSKATYFFEFEANEPGFFASLTGDDEGVALDLPKGPYQLMIEGKDGGAVAIYFLDIDGKPLTDAKMAQLLPHFSEAFGRNTRNKKY